jgi:cysteine sulfinate desulfinase/cysteine desulfurase-like protein/rhodanese-related sulfurtransferase
MNSEIYLDANATSPVLPAAIQAAQDALGACFGNPSSSHAAGLRARALLDDARRRARRVLGAPDGRLLFTSGATEGIQTAVLSSLCAVRARRAAGLPCGDLLLYGATEHKAVPESLAHWNALLGTGLTLHALPVDANGLHRLDALRALAPRAALICTMAANNETGVVSDLDAIAAVLEETSSPALWMVDCVQALGKLPLALGHTRIDYAPFSGHKLHAPKGVGMLYVREGAPYTPLMCGGGQEAGQRSGTENMAGIAALGAVLRALEEGRTFRSHAQLAAARERLATSLRAAFPAIVFNAPFEHALPTTLNFTVPGHSGKALLDLFDAAGVRVSAGSACAAAKAAPSHVLLAMGLPEERSANAVRMSFGPLVDDAFIDAACARIARCGQALGTLPPARCPAIASGAVAGAPISPPPAAPRGLIPCGLDGSALARYLERHPDALLVDVREACEHALGTPLLHGRAAYSLPLSRLPEHTAWLCRETRPLVFFCRSGNRSAQAAQMAQELGHGNVRHLAGGLALMAP